MHIILEPQPRVKCKCKKVHGLIRGSPRKHRLCHDKGSHARDGQLRNAIAVNCPCKHGICVPKSACRGEPQAPMPHSGRRNDINEED